MTVVAVISPHYLSTSIVCTYKLHVRRFHMKWTKLYLYNSIFINMIDILNIYHCNTCFFLFVCKRWKKLRTVVIVYQADSY